MKSIEIKRELEKHFTEEHLVTSYDRDADTFRIVDTRVDKGITVSLSNLSDRFKADKDAALEDTVRQLKEGIRLLTAVIDLTGQEEHIFPILRTPGFDKETKDGKKLLYTDHTAETTIFYAVDHGQSYSMIDEEMLERSSKSKEEIIEAATFNVRALSTEMKQDEVAGNIFYFLHNGDGYDASRILNDRLVKEMADKVEGELAVAVPHHDVLIFADIRNEVGFDVLGQMTFQFFSEGRVPLTALPLMYKDGEFEPVFILAQKKPSSKPID
ncbi:DUF1444 family protein [Paenalkalicoccus suaedae]|uniref:DUF1444 family protein n=1 Tax=Paenalkalicoccus suaedae TaxID=2592382 RepID=A0A859FHG5_9BACI|nr:DUF1444 family protein [Paenalkalicoccus suaedae]QKS72092.1 DUF1444 family protein [Paenalkalicoccus suaedae]